MELRFRSKCWIWIVKFHCCCDPLMWECMNGFRSGLIVEIVELLRGNAHYLCEQISMDIDG